MELNGPLKRNLYGYLEGLGLRVVHLEGQGTSQVRL